MAITSTGAEITGLGEPVTVSAVVCPGFASFAPAHRTFSGSWFVLQVQVSRVFRVRSWLRERDIGEWLPTFQESVRWSDRWKDIERPLFPGYVFARLTDETDTTDVLALPGVIQLLPTSLSPIAIDEDELDQLRVVLASRLPAVPCAYVAGSAVTIETGPLAGVSGVVVRTAGETHVIVGIEMLGRAVRVTVDAADITKK